jgi:hypothetical protein
MQAGGAFADMSLGAAAVRPDSLAAILPLGRAAPMPYSTSLAAHERLLEIG